jgi:transketolase
VLFAYGPVMLNEALLAADMLDEKGFSLKVVNMPWLNRVDVTWLEQVVGGCGVSFVVDNHSPYGGLGDSLLNAAMGSAALHGERVIKFAVDDYPACGTPQEALAYHHLDGRSLAGRVLSAMPGTKR